MKNKFRNSFTLNEKRISDDMGESGGNRLNPIMSPLL